ncbi:hypothetical protein B296_00044239 [Ensete ventricosum]|uniref:AB hydrolase-1 domain-containing protein n=1 Tax=Ensete ventricosum TaxID=4639 RepID=A0A426Z9M4_ENSVE|nr:hypothetical protein B296_00044239 [Ensete ventricosum]
MMLLLGMQLLLAIGLETLNIMPPRPTPGDLNEAVAISPPPATPFRSRPPLTPPSPRYPLATALLSHLAGVLTPFRGLRPVTLHLDAACIHLWAPAPSRSRRLNKHALVLVHGFGGNSKWQWNRQIGALSRSFDLYIPDLVFFGSSRSAGPDRSVGFQSSCVAEAMRRLGVARYSVVGISYGGFVAFRMAEGPAAGAVQRVAILASGICATPEQLRDLTAKEGRDVGELLLPQKAEDLMTLIRRSMYRHPQRIPAFWLQDFIEVGNVTTLLLSSPTPTKQTPFSAVSHACLVL